MSAKRIVVVLGMHRSGTSLITRSLEAIGVCLGDKLMPGTKSDNPMGFWEDLDIYHLNVELLNELGYDWDALSPIARDDFIHSNLAEYKERAIEILKKKSSNAPVYGFKDPRLPRLLPFWKNVFEEIGLEVTYVIAVRNPLSVCKSLAMRNGFDKEKSCHLWMTHVIPSIKETNGFKRVVVDYDRLIDYPIEQLERLAKAIDLENVMTSESQERFVSKFLTKNLRHNLYSIDHSLPDLLVLKQAVKTYRLLDLVASDKKDINSPEVLEQFSNSDQEYRHFKPILQFASRQDTEIKKYREILQDNESSINDYKKTIADQHATINTLQTTIHYKEEKVKDLENSVGEHKSKEEDLKTIVASEVKRKLVLENTIETLECEIRRLDKSLFQTKDHLERILSSPAWKITSPLRYIRKRYISKALGVLGHIFNKRSVLDLEKSEGLVRPLSHDHDKKRDPHRTGSANSLEEIKKYPDFKWKDYIGLNRDLKKAGMNTKDEAIRHWLFWGRHEGRSYQAKSFPKTLSINRIKGMIYNMVQSFSFERALNSIRLRTGQLDIDGVEILFINHEESKTGAPKIIFDIATSLRNKFKVCILSKRRGCMSKEFENQFGRNLILEPKYGLSSKYEVARRVLQRINPKVVYANTLVSYEYVIEAKKLGIPTVLHVHELEDGYRYSKIDRSLSNVRKSADLIIAASGVVKDFLVKEKKFSQHKVIVKHSFIDGKSVRDKSKAISREMVRKKLKVKEDDFVITGCGFGSLRKGIDLFIEAYHRVRSQGFSKIKFFWIGNPNYFHQYANEFNDLREIPIIFLGQKENPYPYLAASDLFLMSSREDPFPLVVLEAMALGKPVLTFRHNGGAFEQLGKLGFYVDSYDAIQLSDKIISLYGQKNTLKQLSNDLVERQKPYSASKITPQIEELISALVRKCHDKQMHRVKDADCGKVSIILPSYNYAWCIHEAIESVISQTYLNWELIIVDDGSMDDSMQIINDYKNKYPDKIRVYSHPKSINKGLAATYRLGLSESKGEFIAFIEADDQWKSDHLLIKMEILKKHPDVILAYNDVELFGDEDLINKRKFTIQTSIHGINKKNHPYSAYKYLTTHNIIPTFSAVVVRKASLRAGDLGDGHGAWIDWHLWAVLSLRGKFYLSTKKTTLWRLHLTSYNWVFNEQMTEKQNTNKILNKNKRLILEYSK